MRNTSWIFILLSFVYTFASCEEDGIVFLNAQNRNLSFEVTIDGKLFSTENVSFTTDNDGILINAKIPETKEIITLKMDNVDLGPFSFEGENNVASYAKNNATSAEVWSTINASSSRGRIELTRINFVKNTVSGTFNFIGDNLSNGRKKAFTSGSFNNVPKGI